MVITTGWLDDYPPWKAPVQVAELQKALCPEGQMGRWAATVSRDFEVPDFDPVKTGSHGSPKGCWFPPFLDQHNWKKTQIQLARIRLNPDFSSGGTPQNGDFYDHRNWYPLLFTRQHIKTFPSILRVPIWSQRVLRQVPTQRLLDSSKPFWSGGMFSAVSAISRPKVYCSRASSHLPS